MRDRLLLAATIATIGVVMSMSTPICALGSPTPQHNWDISRDYATLENIRLFFAAYSLPVNEPVPLYKKPYMVIPTVLLALGIAVYLLKLSIGYRKKQVEVRTVERKLLAKEIEAKEHLIHINEELLETNLKLEKRTDSLREAIEKNKEILGIAAHDLKNPLGGIIGLAEMILEDIEEDNQAAYASAIEHVPLLKQEAERMLHIIKELLDTEREEQHIELKKEQLLLGNIVPTVLRWNHLQAKNKNIQLHYETSATIIVEADEVAIERVLDNYVSNAVKYSPNGAHIWIEMTEVQPSGQTASPIVKVSVRDEGPGLTEEDKAKVFGKMQRLSAKPTGGEHSTGLGLFIVKTLIEAHGGEVGVDSLKGKGAAFWFTLPMVEIELEDSILTSQTPALDSKYS